MDNLNPDPRILLSVAGLDENQSGSFFNTDSNDQDYSFDMNTDLNPDQSMDSEDPLSTPDPEILSRVANQYVGDVGDRMRSYKGISRMTKSNANLEKKIRMHGYDLKPEEPKESGFQRLLNFLNTGNILSANTAANLLGQETLGRKWAKEKGLTGIWQEGGALGKDILGSLSQGLTGKGGEYKYFADVLKGGSPRLGLPGWKDSDPTDPGAWSAIEVDDPTPVFREKKGGIYDAPVIGGAAKFLGGIGDFVSYPFRAPRGFTQSLKVAATSPGFASDVGRDTLGLGLDIALDPTTYLGGGLDDFHKGASKLLTEAQQAGIVNPALKLTDEMGRQAAAKLMAENVVEGMQQAGKVAAGSDEALALIAKHQDDFLSKLKPDPSVYRWQLPGMDEKPLVTMSQFDKTGLPQAWDALQKASPYRLPEDIMRKPIFRSWSDQAKFEPGNLAGRLFYEPKTKIEMQDIGGRQVPRRIEPDLIEPNRMIKDTWMPKPEPLVPTQLPEQKLLDDIHGNLKNIMGAEEAQKAFKDMHPVDIEEILNRTNKDPLDAAYMIKEATDRKAIGLDALDYGYQPMEKDAVFKQQEEFLRGQADKAEVRAASEFSPDDFPDLWDTAARDVGAKPGEIGNLPGLSDIPGQAPLEKGMNGYVAPWWRARQEIPRTSQLIKTRFGRAVDYIADVVHPLTNVSKPVTKEYRKYQWEGNIDNGEIKNVVNDIVNNVPEPSQRVFLSKHLDNPASYPISDLGLPPAETARLEAYAGNLKSMMDPYNPVSWAAQEADMGIIKGQLDNYMAHIYESVPPEMQEVLEQFRGPQGLLMSTKDRHSMERVVRTFDDAIAAGLQPKLDAAEVMGLRMNAAKKAIRTRKFVDNLLSLGQGYVRPLTLNLPPEQMKPIINEIFDDLARDGFHELVGQNTRESLNKAAGLMEARFKKVGYKLPEVEIAKQLDGFLARFEAADEFKFRVQKEIEKYRNRGMKEPDLQALQNKLLFDAKVKAAPELPFEAREIIKNRLMERFDSNAIVPKGFVLTDDLFGPRAYNPMPGHAVTEDIAKVLTMEFKPFTDSKFIRNVDKVTNWWKGIVTAVNPSFHSRNMFSNMYNNWLGGVSDMKPYFMAAASQADEVPWMKSQSWMENYKNQSFKDKLGNEWTIDQLRDLAGQKGIVGEGWFGREIGDNIRQEIKKASGQKGKMWRYKLEELNKSKMELDKAKGLSNKLKAAAKDPDALKLLNTQEGFDLFELRRNYTRKLKELAGEVYEGRPFFLKPMDTGRAVGGVIEDNARLALFYDAIMKGESADQAAEKVYKFLFNYNELAKGKGETIRRFIPFFSWLRGNVPLQVEQLIKQPGKYARIKKVLRWLEGETKTAEDDKDLPDWLKSGAYATLRKPFSDSQGRPLIARMGLPAEDLAKLGSPRETLASLSPALKIPLELALNRNIFFDAPISPPGLEGTDMNTVRTHDLLSNIRNIPFAGKPLAKALNLKVQEGPGGRNVEINPYAHYLLSQLRPLVDYSRITGGRYDPDIAVANFTGPARLYPFDEPRQRLSNMYGYNERLQALLKKLRKESMKGGLGAGSGY